VEQSIATTIVLANGVIISGSMTSRTGSRRRTIVQSGGRRYSAAR
jgi:hypothetical protein